MEAIRRTLHIATSSDENPTKAMDHTGLVKPGDTILLTGATGFVAGHILNSLFKAGFKVKATVHSREKADRLTELYSSRGGDLEVVVVEDIVGHGSFDKAVKGVTGVIHAAYPHVLAKDSGKELLDQAVSGATEILYSIVEHNPSIKRVVLTSSFAAMNDQHKGNWSGHTYSEADWNPIKYEEAFGASSTTSYGASKTLAEHAAWDFVSTHTKPESPQPARFTMASILLPTVIGPIAHDLTTTGSINNSVADIYRLINGCEDKVPMNALWAWADVRDVADAHVSALMAKGKEGYVEDRFFVAAGTYDYNEICKIIERRFPELVEEGGTPHPTDPGEVPYHYKVDNTKVKDKLGIKMRSLEESIVDTVKSLLDYEERTKRGETKEVILMPIMTSRGGSKGKSPEQVKINIPYPVGKGKTACYCRGSSEDCTCPPRTCACEGCTKNTEQQKIDEKVAREKAKKAECTTEEAGEQQKSDKNVKTTSGESEEFGSDELVDKARKTAEPVRGGPSMSAKIDCQCGKGEDACICPPETCSCRGCERRVGKSKFERGDFGNQSVLVGEGKTICQCGGNDQACTCPPETCACKGCGKNMTEEEGVVLNKPKEESIMRD